MVTGFDKGRWVRWLQARLDERSISPRAASMAAGLSHGQISHYLAGNRPRPDTGAKLARYLGVPVGALGIRMSLKWIARTKTPPLS